MDNSFTTLVQSFRDNYLQYKITGADKYKTAYSQAQSAIESAIGSLDSQVKSQRSKLAEFQKEGVEEKLHELDAENKTLQRGILSEHDQLVAAQMRAHPVTFSFASVPTWQYYTIGGLAAGVVLLSLL